MLIKAYGKINLFLKVVNKREDGYHNLESIHLPLKLHDTISIKLNDYSANDTVICDDCTLKYNRYNLCRKAIDVARDKRKFREKFNISIHKNIFFEGGLGGGSADAAATLLGIIKMLNIKTSIQELRDLALKIGSDVPWAITSNPAIVKERGNIIEEFKLKKEYFCILVKSKKGLSTQEVFKNYDSNPDVATAIQTTDADDVVKALHQGKSLKEIIAYTYNDLESTSIKMLPQIQEIKNELKELRFHFVLMSGSGSTVYGLTTVLEKAKRAKKYFANKNLEVELTKIITGRKNDLPKSRD